MVIVNSMTQKSRHVWQFDFCLGGYLGEGAWLSSFKFCFDSYSLLYRVSCVFRPRIYVSFTY